MKVDVTEGKLSYAIILTPDCDLLQDFRDRCVGREGRLFNVLLFGAEEAQKAKDRIRYGRREWKHVEQNMMDQFYYLRAISAHDGLPASEIPDLVVDFKRYFTLSPGEIYRQISLPGDLRANRRCRLNDLWREDLQRKAMSFMHRVGLPGAADHLE